jgi:hypothetical protein
VVGRWATGRHSLTARTLDRVAAAGGVTAKWLLLGRTAGRAGARRADDQWLEAVAALEVGWRQPSRRRLIVCCSPTVVRCRFTRSPSTSSAGNYYSHHRSALRDGTRGHSPDRVGMKGPGANRNRVRRASRRTADGQPSA